MAKTSVDYKDGDGDGSNPLSFTTPYLVLWNQLTADGEATPTYSLLWLVEGPTYYIASNNHTEDGAERFYLPKEEVIEVHPLMRRRKLVLETRSGR